jgi:hypothetical protein
MGIAIQDLVRRWQRKATPFLAGRRFRSGRTGRVDKVIPRNAPTGAARRLGRLQAAVRVLLLGLCASTLFACTYRGGVDEPVTRRFTWFSYLNGDDIRASCAATGEPSYRLVYNGSYEEQLRSYEVVGDGAGGAFFKARVMTGSGIDVTKLSPRDPLGPGRWRISEVRLNKSELAALEAALVASGVFEPAPAGLRLVSHQFYWISSACQDRTFHFNAWR